MDVDSDEYSTREPGRGPEADPEPEHKQTRDSEPAEHQRLSCDSCRNRKVRCDRRDPCSRCVRAKARCTYTHVVQVKEREKRPRVLVSNQFESKIDEISRKVDRICQLFDEKPLLATSRDHSPRSTSTPNTHGVSSISDPQDVNKESPFRGDRTPAEQEHEGESALSAHTAFATRFLQSAVDNDRSSTPIPPETVSALQDLRLRAADGPLSDESSPAEERVPNSAMQLPPAELVFALLRLAKEKARVRYACFLEFESIFHFQEYFLTRYGSQQPTLAEQIIFLCGVHPLFSEAACVTEDPVMKETYRSQVPICLNILEVLHASLPFQLPSTYDYVLALGLSASYNVEKCRPTIAWNFNCAAARMAQALGFHNLALQDTPPSEANRRKIRLFVMIYMNDKMLSLRLGRGSVIRQEEVPGDCIAMLRWVNTDTFLNQMLPSWLRLAQIQGLVYDRLYSPEAQRQPPHVRESRAWGLADELEGLKTLTVSCQIAVDFDREVRAAYGDRLWKLCSRAEKMAQLALKCLVYRNVPPPPGSGAAFCDMCIATAREALMQHQQCVVELTNEESSFLEMYFFWAFHTSPFVPFIVLLCNVVETHNLSDLELLRAMIVSIEGVSDVIPTIARPLRLFRPLFDVASRYIEAKKAAPPAVATDNFDAFFQEANTMDFTFEPALLSTFNNQRHRTEGNAAGLDGQAGSGQYPDAAILDVWGYLDVPYPAVDGTMQ